MAWLNWAEYRLTLTLPCRFKALFSRRAEAVGHGARGALCGNPSQGVSRRLRERRGARKWRERAGRNVFLPSSGEPRTPQPRWALGTPCRRRGKLPHRGVPTPPPTRRPSHFVVVSLTAAAAAGRAERMRGAEAFPPPPPSLSPPLPLHPGTTALAWRAAAQLFFPRQSEIKARAPRGNIVPPVRSPSPPHWRRGGGGRWHGAGRGGGGGMGGGRGERAGAAGEGPP